MTPREPKGRAPFTRPSKVLYSKLKPGPGQSADEVRADQRARLHSATIELTASGGYSGLTVRGISRTAGVSTRTLYAHFANVEECFASTYRWIMRRAAEQLPDPEAEGQKWEDGVRRWIRTLTASMAANSNAGRLVLVDVYDGGPAMLREVEAATEALEHKLAAGSVSTRLSQAIVAGVERVHRTRLLGDRYADLPLLADDLVDWVLSVRGLESNSGLGLGTREGGLPSPSVSAGRTDPAFAIFESIGGDRGRILAAVARLSVAKGYWNLTATAIRREAGVSRRRFDDLFDSVASCYSEAGRTLLAAAARTALTESDESLSWSHRVQQFVESLCADVARSPLLARLGFIDVFAPGRPGLLRRERLLTRSTAWLRAATPVAQRPSELATEASMAASWRIIQAELAAASGFGLTLESSPAVAALLQVGVSEPRANPRARRSAPPS